MLEDFTYSFQVLIAMIGECDSFYLFFCLFWLIDIVNNCFFCVLIGFILFIIMPLLLVKMCSPSHTTWFSVLASVIDTIDFPSSFTNWCEIDRFSIIDFWRDEKASFTWWWWESFAFGKLQLRNLGRKQGFEKQLEKVWNLLCFDESRQKMFKTFLMLCFENL